jgi:hypothetical protein
MADNWVSQEKQILLEDTNRGLRSSSEDDNTKNILNNGLIFEVLIKFTFSWIEVCGL